MRQSPRSAHLIQDDCIPWLHSTETLPENEQETFNQHQLTAVSESYYLFAPNNSFLVEYYFGTAADKFMAT